MLVETLCSKQDVESLKDEWEQLFESSEKSLFFQKYTWFMSWWKFCGQSPSQKVSIVTVRDSDSGKLLLIWPLIIKRRLLLRIAVWPCQGVGQYSDVLMAEAVDQRPWLEAAWKEIHSLQVDLIHLDRVRENAQVYSFLKQKMKVDNLEELTSQADFRHFETWDLFWASRERKFKKRQKRMLRQFSNLGKVEFNVVTEAEEIRQVIREMLRLKCQWLEATGSYGRVLEQPQTVNWLLDISLIANQSGHLNLTTMSIDNCLVAGQLAFISGTELHAQLGVYDMQYRKYGVGRLQIEDAMRWAYENGCQTFDFMPPYDPYKLYWSNDTLKVYSFLSGKTFKGSSCQYFFNESFRKRLKLCYEYLPRPLRKIIMSNKI